MIKKAFYWSLARWMSEISSDPAAVQVFSHLCPSRSLKLNELNEMPLLEDGI